MGTIHGDRHVSLNSSEWNKKWEIKLKSQLLSLDFSTILQSRTKEMTAETDGRNVVSHKDLKATAISFSRFFIEVEGFYLTGLIEVQSLPLTVLGLRGLEEEKMWRVVKEFEIL